MRVKKARKKESTSKSSRRSSRTKNPISNLKYKNSENNSNCKELWRHRRKLGLNESRKATTNSTKNMIVFWANTKVLRVIWEKDKRKFSRFVSIWTEPFKIWSSRFLDFFEPSIFCIILAETIKDSFINCFYLLLRW